MVVLKAGWKGGRGDIGLDGPERGKRLVAGKPDVCPSRLGSADVMLWIGSKRYSRVWVSAEKISVLDKKKNVVVY